MAGQSTTFLTRVDIQNLLPGLFDNAGPLEVPSTARVGDMIRAAFPTVEFRQITWKLHDSKLGLSRIIQLAKVEGYYIWRNGDNRGEGNIRIYNTLNRKTISFMTWDYAVTALKIMVYDPQDLKKIDLPRSTLFNRSKMNIELMFLKKLPRKYLVRYVGHPWTERAAQALALRLKIR